MLARKAVNLIILAIAKELKPFINSTVLTTQNSLELKKDAILKT